MIAIVRWTQHRATLQASSEVWQRTIDKLGRAGRMSAGREIVRALASAEGPDHARRVTLDSEAARIALQHAGEE